MRTHPIRFGLQTGQQNTSWDDMLSLWQNADAWGYDSLWNFDHFYAIYTDPENPCFEGWTTLAALAQATKNARIGHLVNGNTYRHPCVTAKMAMSLDHISGGRTNLGIGAGWFEEEHHSFGLDFKSVRGRLDALEESLQIIKGMLAGERVTLDGDHYQVTDAFCNPSPIQEGGLPIMIGGEGKRILLRIVAQYADMWNAFGTPAKMGELIEIIRKHGDTVGRDTDEIEKTVMLPLCYTGDKEVQDAVVSLIASSFGLSSEDARGATMIGQAGECIDTVEKFRAVGVTHFIFMCFAPYPADQIQAFAEQVLPAFRR